MADRSVSVLMTLSDLEKPDAKNLIFPKDLITLQVIYVIAFAQMHHAVCQRQLSFLFI